jgi:predicted amidohydrolase YtcJ
MEKAEKIYRNGRILTVDDNFSIASAIAIKGDRFIYVGTNAGVAEYIGDKTTVCDLNGKMVTPGIIDSHMHPLSMAERIVKGGLDVRNFSLTAVQEAIASEVAKLQPGQWVTGWSYSVNTLGVEPHKKYLDEVSPNNPVFLHDGSHHAGWVNSRSLEIAGITDETPDPDGGHIVRDEEGHATGLLMEQGAWDSVYTKIPQSFTDEEQDMGDVLASKELLAVGLTSVHDAGRPEIGVVNRRKSLYQSGKIKIRMNDMLSMTAARNLGGPQPGC